MRPYADILIEAKTEAVKLIKIRLRNNIGAIFSSLMMLIPTLCSPLAVRKGCLRLPNARQTNHISSIGTGI
jgi:hypothetical protein